jgi:hypothetical protein
LGKCQREVTHKLHKVARLALNIGHYPNSPSRTCVAAKLVLVQSHHTIDQ